ncbi:stress response protein AzuC [Erwinia sp. S43]|nr:stress response protein AzuC [Erwinia sp. S38]MBK0035668.1 stress response protein AzuC [Erwinia sp. S43]
MSQAIMKKFFRNVFRSYVNTFKHVPPGAVR